MTFDLRCLNGWYTGGLYLHFSIGQCFEINSVIVIIIFRSKELKMNERFFLFGFFLWSIKTTDAAVPGRCWKCLLFVMKCGVKTYCFDLISAMFIKIQNHTRDLLWCSYQWITLSNKHNSLDAHAMIYSYWENVWNFDLRLLWILISIHINKDLLRSS